MPPIADWIVVGAAALKRSRAEGWSRARGRRCDPLPPNVVDALMTAAASGGDSVDFDFDLDEDTAARFVAFVEEQMNDPIPRFAETLAEMLKEQGRDGDHDPKPLILALTRDRPIHTLLTTFVKYFNPPTPQAEFTHRHVPIIAVENQDPSSPGGQKFAAMMTPTEAHAMVVECVTKALEIIHPDPRTSPATPRSITLIIHDLDSDGKIADVRGDATNVSIHISTTYIHAQDPLCDTEIRGILLHESAFAVLATGASGVPLWVRTGASDLVRLRGGFAPPSSARGAGWWEGYMTTARFFDFLECELRCDGFLVSLNVFLGREAWVWDTDEVFSTLCAGRSIRELWDSYRAGKEDGPRDEIDGWPVPRVSVVVKDTAHGNVFLELFTVEEAEALVRETSRLVLRLLYADASAAPGHVRGLSLVVEDMDGVAHCSGDDEKEIHLSSTYVAGVKASRRATEVRGVLAHEIVHVWQRTCEGLPGGVVEGVADYVRLRCGLAPPHWRRCKGGRWDDGYDRTGYFLDWIETESREGFVRSLNGSLEGEWDVAMFKRLTGFEVDELWDLYQLSFDDDDDALTTG